MPRLEAERNYIRMVLEERERSEHKRLKMARDILKEKNILTQIK